MSLRKFFRNDIGWIQFLCIFGMVLHSIVIASIAIAQSEDPYVYQDRVTGRRIFLSDSSHSLDIDLPQTQAFTSSSVVNAFVMRYAGMFGLSSPAEELLMAEQTVDSLGMTHVRYNQVVKGIPVFGATLSVHLTKSLKVKSASGNPLPTMEIDLAPGISQIEAVEIAKKAWNEEYPKLPPIVGLVNEYIFNEGLISRRESTSSYHSWSVELYHREASSERKIYFIGVREGRVLYSLDGIYSDLLRGIADCSYGNGTCYVDTVDSRTGYIYGRSEGQPARGPNPDLGLLDTDNLYGILSWVNGYYAQKFGRNGANGLGGLGDGQNVPAGFTLGRTFIDFVPDPACPNAYFDGNRLNFCVAWTSPDVVGHEYNHGVNFYSIRDAYGNPSGMVYRSESGALNEGFADVFGEAVEYFETGSNDWIFGTYLPRSVIEAYGVRNLADPESSASPLGVYPARFYSAGFYCGDIDNGGTHANATVLSHSAYLVAMGGTYNNCTITGLGRDKEERIYYRALTTYFTPTSSFNDAFNAIFAACVDLFGNQSDECKQVKKALLAVELDQPGRCSNITETNPGPACTTIDTPPPTPTPTPTPTLTPTPTATPDPNDPGNIDLTYPYGTLKIEHGARSTKSAKVLLSITASDPDDAPSDITMHFSNNRRKWSPWEDYGTSKRWDLSKASYGGNNRIGKKTVYMQLSDSAGNVRTLSSSITLSKRGR